MDTLSKTVAAIDSEQQKTKLFVALELARQRGSSPCTLRLPIRSASVASREAIRTN
jgi:hypothetical protein